jgi:hypothetical protein
MSSLLREVHMPRLGRIGLLCNLGASENDRIWQSFFQFWDQSFLCMPYAVMQASPLRGSMLLAVVFGALRPILKAFPA